MNATIRDVDGVSHLQPLQVSSYLLAHGWHPTGAIGDRGAVWSITLPDAGTIEVIVPLDPQLRDFARRMGEVLHALTVAERRSVHQMVTDLTTATADVIRFAFTAPVFEEGAVPLETGVRLVTRARDVVLAGACAAARPGRSVFAARKSPEAAGYMRDVRLGQTERGSFVLAVHSPVPPTLQGSFFRDMEAPFERKVTLTLARALDAARKAAAQAAATSAWQPFQDALAMGVNANLWEAVAGMFQETEARALRVQSSWAPSRPEMGTVPSEITFTADAALLLLGAARLFRVRAQRDEFELEGVVVGLERPEGAAAGVVTIAGVVDEHIRKVRVELGDADYAIAITAHRDRRVVRCEGELVKEGRMFFLRDPRLFVLDEDE